MATPAQTNPILAKAEETARMVASRTEDLSKELQTSAQELTKVGTEQQKAVSQRVASEQIIAGQAAVSELQAQNAAITFFESTGGIEFLKKAGVAYNRAAEDVLAAEAEVERVAEDDYGGGVLGWLKKQFAIDSANEGLANAQQRTTAIRTVTSEISSQTESVARAVNFTKQSKNQATLEAEQSRIESLAIEEKSKTAADNIKTNANAISAVMSATSQELSARLKLYELSNSEADRQMRVESHAVNMKVAKLQLNKLELDEQTVQMYIPIVQNAQAAAGSPVEDPLIIRNGIEEIKKNTPTGQKYQRYVEMGLRGGNYGFTPSEAAETLSIVAPTGTEMTPPLKILEAVKFKQNEKTKSPTYIAPKNKTEAEASFNATARELSDSWKSNIKPGDTTNHYHAPPFAALAESDAVKSSLLYKNVLAPLELKEFSAKKLFQEAARGVTTKLISPEEATLGIETVIKAAISHNNEHWQFAKVGVAVQDSYVTYADPIDTFLTAGKYSFPSTVYNWGERSTQEATDISDPVQIKNLLIKYVAQQVKQTAFTYGAK